MRRSIPLAAVALLLLACSPIESPAGGGPGSGGAPATHALSLRVTGAGDVRSSSPAFDCRTQCSQTLPDGTRLQLSALPEAGSVFTGWQGACTGSADCTLTLDADREVVAIFEALPPPPPGTARLSVAFTGKGSGKVTSTPAGISCPGACSLDVQPGTTVSLAATPDASSTFAGWGGACSGTSCTATVTSDKTAYANFELSPPVPATSCQGIAAPDPVAMKTYVHPVSRTYYNCQPGVGDASGTLALPMTLSDPGTHGSVFEFVTSAGALIAERYVSSEGPRPLQQPAGIVVWGDPGHMYPYNPAIKLTAFGAGGSALGDKVFSAEQVGAAADPAGGLLLAGDLGAGQQSPRVHSATMYNVGNAQPSVRWGPKSLSSSGAVFGAGVDLDGRSLVITGGGAGFVGGTITGQWFDRNGSFSTGEFALITGFTPGPSTWFEADPLVGGGLVVRRMDFDGVRHAQPLVVIAGASSTPQPAPAWMTARPDRRFQVARGGKAYAVIPFAARGASCSQRLEIVAPDGTSCGRAEYQIAAGTCDTGDLMVGADGTVIQQLPEAMETRDPVNQQHSCTWRFWPAAAK